MLDDTLVDGATDLAEGCEFPLSLGREAVGRLEDTILATSLTRLTAGGGVEVGELVLLSMTADVILKVGRPEFEFLLWHFLSVTLNTLPSLYPFSQH